MRVPCRVHITIEASLAIATGFNLFCVVVAVVYIITLKVDPEDFRWLQPKPKEPRDGAEGKVRGARRLKQHTSCLEDILASCWAAPGSNRLVALTASSIRWPQAGFRPVEHGSRGAGLPLRQPQPQ
jgi:hypothetical protein